MRRAKGLLVVFILIHSAEQVTEGNCVDCEQKMLVEVTPHSVLNKELTKTFEGFDAEQFPRVFYRREPDLRPLVVARP